MNKEIKIALLMASSLFIEILDGTIVTTALPKIAEFFSIQVSTVSVLISVYFITVAVFIPLSGWAAKKYGKKNLWLVAVLGFTLSSLGNAIAPNFIILLVMRIIQGVSGALMLPTARLIVLESTPPNKMLKMTSYLVWPALIAPAIAPLIGGAIVTYLNWQWIFFINIPIGLTSIFIGIFLIPNDYKRYNDKFDLFGFMGIAISSIFLLTGSELLTQSSNFANLTGGFGVIIGFITMLIVYVHLKNSKKPLFSIDSLKVLTFRITQTSGSILWVSVGAMPYLLTIYLQNIFEWSAIKAGTFVLFIFIGNITIKPFTTIIIKNLRYKNTLQTAFLLVLLSSGLLSLINVETPHAIIMLLAFLSGVGRSLALTAYNGLNLSEISIENRNSANTLNSVTKTFAQGLGVTLIAIVLHFLQLNWSGEIAYKLGFIFLGVLMLYPIYETSKLDSDIGSNTI
ncbi:MFS transporter [Staphylococcus xylosus]|uniref:MFS transporter n=1 Tax=Staphylococcus xylosus TaxID=1288 RepID=UPI000E68617E|nr:MFS transporter [Staphylococcus xylosus]RIM75276.1 MFS transporter [Staphylococcus xylosus]